MPPKTADVRFTLFLRATPQRVWAALTEDRQLARWYTKATGHVLKKGGDWGFRDGKSTGRVLELKKNARLVHSQKDDPEYPTMKLEYTIEKWGKDSILRFRHSGFGGNAFILRCWKGIWPFMSCQLKTFVETGRPLREGSWA
ncbi:MAG: SRPBCC domain-containing protein [Planctomycetes bacterium]|nr:SRPBCC domain-containing protein [Planctomycetota bacterium]